MPPTSSIAALPKQLSTMKQLVVLFVLWIITVAAALSHDEVEQQFLKASEVCFKREKLTADYQAKFNKFDYPDEEPVQKFLLCTWNEMGFWNDRTGFEIEKIADLYKDRANTEILIPILSECSTNEAKEAPLKWSYRSFMCIMRTQVGEWFREDRKKHQAQNGH